MAGDMRLPMADPGRGVKAPCRFAWKSTQLRDLAFGRWEGSIGSLGIHQVWEDDCSLETPRDLPV